MTLTHSPAGWIYTCPDCNGAHGQCFDVADGSGRFGAQYARSERFSCDECEGPEARDFDGEIVMYRGVECYVSVIGGSLYLNNYDSGDDVAILTSWDELSPVLELAA